MLQKFDARNSNILIYVNGELLPRDMAKVSVFDSVVQGGDAVWEGIRVYNGRLPLRSIWNGCSILQKPWISIKFPVVKL